MNLVLDIGNSVSKYYLYDDDTLRSHGKQVGHTLDFIPRLLSDCAHADDGALQLEAAIISTVVNLPVEAEAQLRALPCPLIRFSSQTPIPLVNRYRTPATLGTDRLAAAVGAWTLQPNHPLLIIDAGSCITFDFVSPEGEYIGGNIAPGLHARLQAIGDYFPRLPLVDAEGPAPELGYDTQTAIRSGVIQGMQHEIEGYIHHFCAKYPQLFVFLTGGDEFRFANPPTCSIFANKFLVPYGLNAILKYSKRKNYIPQ